MTFRELCRKQVVQTLDGTILGRVDDLVLEPSGCRVQAFVLYGAPRLFGLLGRGPDLEIPLAQVRLFGADVLLVDTDLPRPAPAQQNSLLARLTGRKPAS